MMNVPALAYKKLQPRARGPTHSVELGGGPLLETEEDKTNPTEEFSAAPVKAFATRVSLFSCKPRFNLSRRSSAFEPVLRWRRTRQRSECKIFLDQAMRVPKLLMGAELRQARSRPRCLKFRIHQVSGRRRFAEFSGISPATGEDVRLISTLGFVNLPEEVADRYSCAPVVSISR